MANGGSTGTQDTNRVEHTTKNTTAHSDGGQLSWGETEGTRHQQTLGEQHDTSEQHQTNAQHQKGGSTGVTAATGQVNDATQRGYESTQRSYQQSAQVQQAYAKLQETLNNKPGAFSSQYTKNIEDLYNQIMNRQQFSYNPNSDAMYNMYKDLYQQQGKSAMQDTVAQSSALTGGYGNSYGTTAGSQAYQSYLQKLNELVPQLQQNAFNMYQQEGNELYNKANLSRDLYNQDYQQYRDTVSDWQKDRDFYSNYYNNERGFDYGQFTGDRDYFSKEYWNQRNAEQTTNNTNYSDSYGNSDTYGKSDSYNKSFSDETSHTKSYEQARNWSDSWENSTQDSNINEHTTTTQNTWSDAGSGGSSGGSKSGSKSGSTNVHDRIGTAVNNGSEMNKLAEQINSLSESQKQTLINKTQNETVNLGGIPVTSGDIVYLMQKGLI